MLCADEVFVVGLSTGPVNTGVWGPCSFSLGSFRLVRGESACDWRISSGDEYQGRRFGSDLSVDSAALVSPYVTGRSSTGFPKEQAMTRLNGRPCFNLNFTSAPRLSAPNGAMEFDKFALSEPLP